MTQNIKHILLTFASWLGKIWYQLKAQLGAVLAGVFAFALVFGSIYMTVSREMVIKNIRTQLERNIFYLNELGLDIAYDKIEFNALFFFPLVQIDNLRLYNLDGLNNWSVGFNQVKAYPNIFGTSRLRFESLDGGEFTFNDFSSQMSSSQTFLDITTHKNQLQELVFHADDVKIKDFAKIKKIALLLQKAAISPRKKNITAPSFESFFEVNDVDINGLMNYPLSSHLKLLYLKTDLIGQPQYDEYLLTSMESWLKDGGFIEVPSLILQWEPLTLVGRGSVNFNEQFDPRISFNTSSKGLLRLLQDLQDKEYLDKSNVFVANILLSHKAFKLNEDDKELTISTPIGYGDGKITVENLTIKDFTK